MCTCRRESNPAEATVAMFVPTANNGCAEIIPIRRSKKPRDEKDFSGGGGVLTWCLFQKLKYVWDEEKKAFRGLEFPTDRTFAHYASHTGR